MPLSNLRQKADGRLGGLRSNRYSWWIHWQECANYILPRRYKWLVTPNQAARGSPLNQHIIDSTGTLAARVLVSGLQSGLTNPMSPWFKFNIDGFEDESSDVALWLAECAKRMYRVFQESNFYNAMATMYFDLVVFGTAVVLIYEDFENVINCYNPCAGEYFLDADSRLVINTFYREFVQTCAQIVEEYGLENCPDDIQSQYKTGGAGLTREWIVRHMIEANMDNFDLVPKLFKYREMYWVAGADNDSALRTRGFHEMPGIFPRWDLVANDPYGRSPGMDALGDIKQLQQETKRKAQAIDKMVNPPMIADVQLKNQPASLLPGGVTYVSGLSRERPAFAPAYTILPPIAEMKQDIQEVQLRIQNTFYNRLFTDIMNLQTVRSATEIEARREEKLVLLPVIKRVDNEALSKSIERTWAVMLRGGLLPPPPAEAVGKFIGVQYISPFALAMRAAEATAIERSVAFGGSLAAADQTVLDNYNLDSTVHIYNTSLGADPRIMATDEQRDEKRQQRAAAMRQQQVQQETTAAVQGAKVLSDTQVGGGQSALERMLGG